MLKKMSKGVAKVGGQIGGMLKKRAGVSPKVGGMMNKMRSMVKGGAAGAMLRAKSKSMPAKRPMGSPIKASLPMKRPMKRTETRPMKKMIGGMKRK